MTICFNYTVVNGATGDLILEKVTDCGTLYMGDTCIVKMKVTNNAEEVLGGKFTFNVVVDSELFDGEGISAKFLSDIMISNWLNSSSWVGGTVEFSGFEIATGETFTLLEINTHPALYPGQYDFIFSLFGTTEDGKEYVAPPVSGSGGGGSLGIGSIFGDINGDGKVDKYDLALLMSYWGQRVSGLLVDLSGDGKVDKYDFSLLMLNWGK